MTDRSPGAEGTDSANASALGVRLRLGALLVFLACGRTAPIAPLPTPDPPAPEPTSPPVVAPLPPPPVPSPPLPEPPAPTRELDSRDLEIRVGLVTDRETVAIPAGRTVVHGDRRIALEGGATVRAHARVRARPVWRLQAAALKDEGQALDLARDLETRGGLAAEATFDAGSDLYRVRWGRFSSREEAEEARGRLATLGVVSAWAVSEGGALAEAAFELSADGRRLTLPGRTLTVEGPEREFVFDGVRHRGEMHLFLNDRGLLNVVAFLPLEEYLRGVVPREMGPDLYPELEALKAQAVAARTFTLLNLGAFEEEGYDLCSTPRCQVYGGKTVEHPLSDRAIRETEGQVVLLAGRPVETLYSATCGGHTENVATVFPAKTGAHLRGVACLEQGSVSVGGGARPGTGVATVVAAALSPATSSSGEPRSLLDRVGDLALLAGVRPPAGPAPPPRRGAWIRWVDAGFADRPPTPAWSGLLGSWDVASGDRDLAPGDEEELLFALGERLGVWERQRLAFLEIHPRQLVVHGGGPPRKLAFTGTLPTWFAGGTSPRAEPLELVPGDPVDVLFHRDRALALVQPRELRPVSLARHAGRQRWTRTRSHAEVRRHVQGRYPGFPFADLEVEERGVSGRIGRVLLIGTDGRRLPVEGLAIRWTLDLPDTLFEWVRTPAANGGEAGWFFRGRGWGHGVGLCQLGSFGMSRRGLTYGEILHHYYGGVELGRARPRRFGLSDDSSP